MLHFTNQLFTASSLSPGCSLDSFWAWCLPTSPTSPSLCLTSSGPFRPSSHATSSKRSLCLCRAASFSGCLSNSSVPCYLLFEVFSDLPPPLRVVPFLCRFYTLQVPLVCWTHHWTWPSGPSSLCASHPSLRQGVPHHFLRWLLSGLQLILALSLCLSNTSSTLVP